MQIDLEGRTPMPGWQKLTCALLAIGLFGFLAADVLGFVPRPQPDSVFDQLTEDVQIIKDQQTAEKAAREKDRLDQERFQAEVRKEFTAIHELLKEKRGE